MTQMTDWIGYHALKGIQRFVCRLPFSVALHLGSGLGRVAYYFTPRRKIAYADLKAVFGKQFSELELRKILHKHFAHLGQMLVETLRMPLMTSEIVDQVVERHHWERFETAVKADLGAIFLTAHMGNWELCQLVSGHQGSPIHVLGQSQKHSRLNQYLKELRETHGAKAIEVGMGIRGLLKVLKEKKTVGILGDNSPGRDKGIVLSFLGRKTSIATGAFELAQRTQASVVPCFMVRRKNFQHDLSMEEPIQVKEHPGALEEAAALYVKKLEQYIRRYPDQWLWEMKRWKYTWTKRILILSDGKPGHEKQSVSVADRFKEIESQYDRPGLEYPTERIQVCFKSEWHQKLFSVFAFFFIPFAQGNLRFMSWFFEKECFEKILKTSADFIISAGASLVPLNLCLAEDSRAKTVILMNPSLPFNFHKIDLAVIPAHDSGWMPRKSLRLILTPAHIQKTALQKDAEALRSELKAPERIKFAVFLGGETRQYKMSLSAIEFFYSTLQRISEKYGDYVITTSRRTPEAVTRYLHQRIIRDPRCQLFVVGKEDRRPEVMGGMMDFAEYLLVSEDSISMISEAVTTGKKVIVVSFSNEFLPAKHRRFQRLLAEKKAVQVLTPARLEAALSGREPFFSANGLIQEETEALQKKLREIL